MIRIILIFFLCVSSANAITLTQTVVSEILFDLTPVAPTDAGDYFKKSYSRDATLITIDGIPNGQKWKVSAKLSNYVHSGQEQIRISIKRRGKGTGVHDPIVCDDTNSYVELNNTTYKCIFMGKGSRFNIPMKTRISGIGVTDDYGTFNTTIEFKVETY